MDQTGDIVYYFWVRMVFVSVGSI